MRSKYLQAYALVEDDSIIHTINYSETRALMSADPPHAIDTQRQINLFVIQHIALHYRTLHFLLL